MARCLEILRSLLTLSNALRLKKRTWNISGGIQIGRFCTSPKRMVVVSQG